MTTALIYVRQSRHKDYERTVSPEVQEQACRALAAVKRCAAVEVFTDLDVSGGKRARRGYDAMLARIRAGGVAVVAAYDQSRAFRSTLLAAEFKALLDESDKRTIEVVFVQGSFDRSPVGGFSYAVLAAAHEMERRMTGEKVRGAYAYLNAAGKPTGMSPFGYRRVGDALAIEGDEAAVVRHIFDEYAAGDVSARELARKLNEAGVKRGRSRTTHGAWLADTVVDTLRNVAYAAKTYTAHRQRRQGELVAASWAPIVEAATFERVQRLLDSRRVSKRSAVKGAYVFQGLLKCAECGQPMRVRTTYGIAYYHCREDVPVRCLARPIREDVVLAWADALMSSVAILNEDGWNDAVRQAGAQRKAQGRSVAGVMAALERTKKLYQWGDLTDEAYKRERTRLEALKAEASAESAPRGIPPAFADVHKEWLSADVARRRRVLARLFEALYVESREVVRYAPRAEYAEEVHSVMRAIKARGAMYLVPQSGRTGRRRLDVSTGRGKGGLSIRTPLKLEAAVTL